MKENEITHGGKVYKIPGFNVADMVQYVTGQLPPAFVDWPANIQDKLLQGVEELNRKTNRNYALYHMECLYDYDREMWYVYAVCTAKVLQ